MSIRDDMVQKVLGNPGKYSIQQLQAAMKSGSLPAYVVVPIIQDKVQQQKQMQAAMQQQQPPQSTIAEQVMQEAAQMGGGVEQLPSNLPQEYAEGGIVAFGDGGEVERYQNTGLVESEEQRRAREAYEEANPFLRLRKKKKLTDEEAAALAAGETEQQRYYGRPDTSLTDAASAFGRGLRALIPGAGEAAIPSGMEAEMGGGYQAPPVDTSLPTSLTRPDIMTGRSAPPAAGPGAAGPGAAPAGFTPAAYRGPSMLDQTNKLLYGTETEPGFVARSTARQAAKEEEAKRLRGLITGQAYEGLEKALQKEEEGRGVEKDQAKYMAIFKAGLAMMAGTSPNAFENIGKGAMVGVEDYQKAASDIKKAQKEHQRMMAQIEQARRAEKRGDVEQQLNALEKKTEYEERRDQFVMNALSTAGGKDADRLFETWKLNTEGGFRMGAARLGAESRENAALMRLLLGGGAGEKGAMTAKQRGDTIRELRNSKEALDYRKQLIKRFGSNSESTPQFQDAFNEFVNQLYEKDYGRRGVAPATSGVGLSQEDIDLIRKNLGQK